VDGWVDLVQLTSYFSGDDKMHSRQSRYAHYKYILMIIIISIIFKTTISGDGSREV